MAPQAREPPRVAPPAVLDEDLGALPELVERAQREVEDPKGVRRCPHEPYLRPGAVLLLSRSAGAAMDHSAGRAQGLPEVALGPGGCHLVGLADHRNVRIAAMRHLGLQTRKRLAEDHVLRKRARAV